MSPTIRRNTVSVIDTATNTVIATIPVGSSPFGVAVTPDGSKVYVANDERQHGVGDRHGDQHGDRHRSPSASVPYGVAVTPDGSKVYVTNTGASTVSVIDTATNTVIDHDPRRQPAPWRGGHPGRQQGLCHQLSPPAPCR